MNVDDEFATIDAILASEAETRGVDAFALALLKAERQMRKLFTYLVFQSDAFSSRDVRALRNALSDRRLYFRDFVLAWEKLYARPLKEIVGSDHERLYAILNNAIDFRNKIFHGQLTARYLSRKDLITLVAQIRCWCRALAAGSQSEIGYDGFGRNSFHKSASPLTDRLVTKMNDVQEYVDLLVRMEERRRKAAQSTPGS